MMNMLRRWCNNPANPKKVQISFMAVIGIIEFLERIDASTLSSEDREAYEYIRRELLEKKSKVRNRQAYTAIVHATGDDKQAALESYLQTKQLKI